MYIGVALASPHNQIVAVGLFTHTARHWFEQVSGMCFPSKTYGDPLFSCPSSISLLGQLDGRSQNRERQGKVESRGANFDAAATISWMDGGV